MDAIAAAGLLPSAEQLEMFAGFIQEQKFSVLLSRFLEVCRVEKVTKMHLLPSMIQNTCARKIIHTESRKPE